jgi:hypothetical protein
MVSEQCGEGDTVRKEEGVDPVSGWCLKRKLASLGGLGRLGWCGGSLGHK